MALDDLVNDFLAPVKWADEQVLRQYTKLTMKWEEKGRSRYGLANFFIIGTLPSFLLTFPTNLTGHLIGGLYGWEVSSNNFTKPYGFDINVRDAISVVYENPFITKVDRGIRLPLILAGAGFLGKAVYDVISYFKTGESSYLYEALTDLNFALPFFGISSSMYVKDRDPKLLQKALFWKTAYHWCKEKLSEFSPEPAPQPVPVKAMQLYPIL